MTRFEFETESAALFGLPDFLRRRMMNTPAPAGPVMERWEAFEEWLNKHINDHGGEFHPDEDFT